MKIIPTKIDFTQPEHNRIVEVGNRLCNGVKVSFRSLCKRLIMIGVEKIEKGEKIENEAAE